MRAADVRAGDVVLLPNGAEVEVSRVTVYDGNDDGCKTIVITYRSYHELVWEASKWLASQGVKGERLVPRPDGIEKMLTPFSPDEHVPVVRRRLEAVA